MKQTDTFWTESLHIFVLFSFALAQPLFDLLSRQAEFFVARRSEPIDIILLTLILCVLFPVVVVLIEGLIGWLSPWVRKGLHGLVIVGLVAAITLPALLRVSEQSGIVLVGGAVLMGFIAALSYQRFSSVRMFLTVLAPALLLFPGLFLFASPVFHVVFPSNAPLAPPVKVEATTPVVMVIFDELPLTALMDEQHQIDSIRYPNFAALAQEATWFRNTTTVGDTTLNAVPAILSGVYPDRFRLPRALDYPHSLFTLLGESYHLKVFESLTQICPQRLCGSGVLRPVRLTRRMAGLVWDLSVVYLHLLLPPDLREGLPIITQDWMNFAAGTAAPNDLADLADLAQKRSRLRQWVWEDLLHPAPPYNRPQKFFQFLDEIRPLEQPTLYFLHINLPHPPFIWLPSGKNYLLQSDLPGLVSEKWNDEEWATIQGYQRHLLQIGFADTLLGKLIERLRAVALYDHCLLVITSDHGASYRPGDFRRHLTQTNFQDIIPVPLFIKPPLQRKGGINDRPVETIDILPTIADFLDIPFPWNVDGHSAFDFSVPDRVERTVFRSNTKNERLTFEAAALEEERDKTLKRKLALFGSGVVKPNGLFYPYPNLVNRRVNDISTNGEASVTVTIDQAGLFTMVDPASTFIPAHITGQVHEQVHENGAQDTPLQLAIAVNGRIQAVTRTWTFPVKGEKGYWSAVVDETAFRSGHNDVEVFVLSTAEGKPVLERATINGAYSLSQSTDKGHEVITSSDGRTIPVIPNMLYGWVDSAEVRGRHSVFKGWAVDEKNAQLPEAILVFIDGQFFYAGQTGFQKPGLAGRFGNPTFARSGFYYTFPSGLFEDRNSKDIRFFAVSKNSVASELNYVKGYRWKKNVE